MIVNSYNRKILNYNKKYIYFNEKEFMIGLKYGV